MSEVMVDGRAGRVARGQNGGRPVLEVIDVTQEFRLQGTGSTLNVLSHVSLRVNESETVGIVGESGSGKTTLARTIVQLPPPKSGHIIFLGRDLTRIRGRRLRRDRSGIQMVFQDSHGSLNPKWRVFDIVEEPLIGFGVAARSERCVRVEEVLDLVGLPESQFGRRRPGELSGGQCQRVAIARAVVSRPALVVCDEAVSSLDVLNQAQILRLFRTLQDELGISYLFISHDLHVVSQISDRIAVMHHGQICEIAPAPIIFHRASHPYTRTLLAYVRSTEASSMDMVEVEAPSQLHPPSGCRYRTRCRDARGKCAAEEPSLTEIRHDHFVACHFPKNEPT